MIGHDEPWTQWRAALDGPRMHHAWLLAGKRSTGKMRFARQAARELVQSGGAEAGEGAHPDVIELTHLPKDDKEEKKREEGKPFEFKRNITIGQIRAMQQRLTTRPTLGSRRAIIIDPADDLETNAANALLKSLEEPPAGTYFLLIAHRPARLLPTIRSRCRTLRFPALSDTEIDALLSSAAPEADREQRSAAILAAGGSPGAALDFIRLGLGRAGALMQRIVADGDPNYSLRGELASIIGVRPNRLQVQSMLDLARSTLASTLQDWDAGRATAVIHSHEELVALTSQAPIYNFDPSLLVTEIGNLLARAAPRRERANA